VQLLRWPFTFISICVKIVSTEVLAALEVPMDQRYLVDDISPVVPPPVQLDAPEAPYLIQVDAFVRATPARTVFDVSGQGLCAAILDTGLNTQHVDFAGRVIPGRNFTSDYGGDPQAVNDGNGHGTNVAGIVLAGGDHTGMAPLARVAPLKVLRNDGGGSFTWVAAALDWVLAQRTQLGISVVCLSLSDGRNYTDDSSFAGSELTPRIAALRRLRVPVVIAAGNHYYAHGCEQGMAYPAILRETVSVGAVYDSDGPGFQYRDGSRAFSASAGQLTPFSQRLHPTLNPRTYTDIFAPGAPVKSSGINGPHGESEQSGTSQAAPVTAGIILLLQEYWLRACGRLPTVNQLLKCLRSGGVTIADGDNEDDNVRHTGLEFIRLDAMTALEAAQKEQAGKTKN
jgi:subtilisin family serine protease